MSSRLLFGFILVLACAAATAEPPVPASPVMKPVIEPPMPTAETPISVYFRTGNCEFIHEVPWPPELVRNGSELDLLVDGSVGHGMFCNTSSGVVGFDIGTLPAGTYRLRLVIREQGTPTFTWPYDATTTEFTVLASAHAVPAGHAPAWALLGIALCAAAAHARRRLTAPS